LGSIRHERCARFLIDEFGLEISPAVLNQSLDVFAKRAQRSSVVIFGARLGRDFTPRFGWGSEVVDRGPHRRKMRARRNPVSAARPTAVPGLLRTNSRASSPSCSMLLSSRRLAVSCSLRDALRA